MQMLLEESFVRKLLIIIIQIRVSAAQRYLRFGNNDYLWILLEGKYARWLPIRQIQLADVFCFADCVCVCVVF